MAYQSKFSGAEVDARLEKMLNVTWAELVALRDEGQLIAGQMYRMTDYETYTSKAGSQSAGHPFDLVLTALDNRTLDEKCSAIWSERDTDGYFANSNLPAWDVRYCLDNDAKRFDWAVAKGKSIGVDLSAMGVGNVTATLNGTFVYNDTTYARWDTSVQVEGMKLELYILTPNEDVTIGSTPIVYVVAQGQGMEGGTITSVTINENEGKGVIYRLVDENRNDVPYDFKNIQFVRKITDGALDLESGTDTFCYTFSDFSSGVLLDDSFGAATSNIFGTGCWDNVFLGNLFYSNTFGNYCYSNTFGDECYSNTFGNYCYSNTFGDECYSNTFGDECYSNVFGDRCHSNVFGDRCQNNTFGDNCRLNTFGSVCLSNTFGEGCYSNTFRNYCQNNTFGDNCYSNTFGESSGSNSFGDNCYYNVFRDNCDSNSFGDNCYYNTLGDFCKATSFGNYCTLNTFGDVCDYNSFGTADAPLSYIRYYKVDCVSRTEIAATANRSYVTYVTKNSAGNVVQYTIDDILNA